MSARDFVIATPQEFHQTNAMAERIGQVGDAAPLAGMNIPLQRRARKRGLSHGGVHILDDEVEMDRGPVALIVTLLGVAMEALLPAGLTSR